MVYGVCTEGVGIESQNHPTAKYKHTVDHKVVILVKGCRPTSKGKRTINRGSEVTLGRYL